MSDIFERAVQDPCSTDVDDADDNIYTMNDDNDPLLEEEEHLESVVVGGGPAPPPRQKT